MTTHNHEIKMFKIHDKMFKIGYSCFISMEGYNKDQILSTMKNYLLIKGRLKSCNSLNYICTENL